MIITRTPFRISFVGGGSDLEAFYKQSKGAVLSTSINKYMYISSHKFFEQDKIRAKYSKTETVSAISELQHPIIREVLSKYGIKGGLEVSSIADVPGGTGMGSSSSFTVGMLHNISAVVGNEVARKDLAEGACDIEINVLNEPIGKQDQYAAAYGGLNIIEFNADGTVKVDPISISSVVSKNLQENLLMFYTGDQRSASKILKEQKKNTSQKDKFETLKQMVSLVYELKSCLLAENLDEFGKLLHENWLLKKSLAKGVSNEMINTAYDVALKHGAIGGKLLGAGGGGFLLFYCPKSQQENLISAMRPMKQFEFNFESQGSKLIYQSR